MLDVLIQTHNEELNLPFTLASVKGLARRVFVVDSGSTDRTRDIALEAGAAVVQKPWEGYAKQKNWALDNLPFESEWVLILDADESVSPALRDEILAIVSRPVDQVRDTGFLINRLTIFMGREIRHCAYFPAWNLRLFKRGLARYEEREVHEHMIVQGPTSQLKNLLFHEDRRGLEHFIAKHNRYSTLEAMEIYRQREKWPGWRRMFSDRIARRRWVKYRMAPKLPMPWFFRFVYMYFIRGGILDRRAGLNLCLLISSYELFIRAKHNELVRTGGKDPSGIAGLATAEGGKGADEVLPQVLRMAPPIKLEMKEVARPQVSAPVISPEDSLAADTATAPVVPPEGASSQVVASDLVVSAPRTLISAVPKTVRSADPTRRGGKEPSPWKPMDNLKRALWMIVRAALFRPSFHNWYGWRRLLLRLFGAKLGKDVRIRPTASVEIPWNLEIGDKAIIGDYAILYSLGKITIGSGAVVSQFAHLCAGTHDYTSRRFPLLRPPITIGQDVWIAADAFIGPGVTVGDRAVVGARTTVVKDVPADQVVAGPAAISIKQRVFKD
jgi:acetyltransferase-like isoleucine patch superfamily enzyme/glycosyltransferase involved in cell wall biosynthesis